MSTQQICTLYRALTGEEPTCANKNLDWKAFCDAFSDVEKEIRVDSLESVAREMAQFEPIPLDGMKPEFASGFTTAKCGLQKIVSDKVYDLRFPKKVIIFASILVIQT